ncbi:hypothetical protein HDIA_0203 [Hartmannibacter diazotrophicus]|uniref:Activator of Hsp90 ATPase homologue 1/2-like C-terminal domain-containing protein n=1 Tax=Hartmannibacter diazotrophicus TaxID=1482074 RepID=A0A2C9D0I3_9HYPH|nr:SRPBCC family protein [Hartmannibacter diazotrophicus]SON53744.1 hypothetical protein HDIA_0203 [Hartmannibacter diazotrophicus]
MMTAAKPDPGSDRTVVISRTFAAPRALVYRAFTDPEILSSWFGPRGFDVPVCELDVRPGGRLKIVMRGPDGTDYPNTGTYLEVEPERRLRYTNEMDDHPKSWHDMLAGHRGVPVGTPLEPPVATVEFSDVPGGTLVTITSTFATAGDRHAFLETGMRAGWAACLDKLAELAATDFTGEQARDIVMTRFIAAPVALVWSAFNDVDRISAWWGPDGFTTTAKKFEFRVGGEWVHTMHGPDGTDHPNRSIFREIVENEKIVYDHDDGSGTGPHMFRATTTFKSVDGGTEITHHMVFADPNERRRAAGFGAIELGYQHLGNLAAFVTGK